jgi:hypothetical protein
MWKGQWGTRRCSACHTPSFPFLGVSCNRENTCTFSGWPRKEGYKWQRAVKDRDLEWEKGWVRKQKKRKMGNG